MLTHAKYTISTEKKSIDTATVAKWLATVFCKWLLVVTEQACGDLK